MRRTDIDPTLLDRLRLDGLRGRLRPGWLRPTVLRRAAAVGLLLIAGALLVAGRSGDGDPVLVAARDLRPGSVLTAEDLSVAEAPGSEGLSGLLHGSDQAVGRRLAGAVRAGEPVTGSRLLSSRLPSSLTGQSGARLVPVSLADAAVAALLREGDVVDVLDEEARVLARSAVVALPTSGGSKTLGSSSGSPVLLAMGEQSALRVAAAGLGMPITVVLH